MQASKQLFVRLFSYIYINLQSTFWYIILIIACIRVIVILDVHVTVFLFKQEKCDDPTSLKLMKYEQVWRYIPFDLVCSYFVNKIGEETDYRGRNKTLELPCSCTISCYHVLSIWPFIKVNNGSKTDRPIVWSNSAKC